MKIKQKTKKNTHTNRTKLDPNRNSIDSCTILTDDCHLAYTDYHTFIDTYFKAKFANGLSKGSSKSMPNYRQGLLIDLHGQSHPGSYIIYGILAINSATDRDPYY